MNSRARQKRICKNIRETVKLMSKAVDRIVREIAELERIEKALKTINKKH